MQRSRIPDNFSTVLQKRLVLLLMNFNTFRYCYLIFKQLLMRNISYIERDVRQITKVENLSLFQKFLKLCAGSTGQLLNISSLASDCGISAPTARSWLSILEASYIIFLLQPYPANFRKRLVKSPKLYFYDTGLACSLVGVSSPDSLQTHYLRGGLFESYIIADFIKRWHNAGKVPHIYFWRDSHRHEVDCIIENDTKLIPVEIKSGMTISGDYTKPIYFWNELTGAKDSGYVIYTGPEKIEMTALSVYNWKTDDEIEIFKK